MRTEEVAGRRAGERLHGGAAQPRAAEPLVDRRDLRRPRGRRPRPARDDTNRTFGLDGRWGIGEYGQVSGFVAQDRDPGHRRATSTPSASAARYDSDDLVATRSTTPRSARASTPRSASCAAAATASPTASSSTASGPRSCGASTSCGRTSPTAASGASTTSRRPATCTSTTTGSGRTATSSTPASTSPARGCARPFEIVPGVVVPPGTYDHEDLALVFFTNQGAPASFSRCG